MQSDTAQSRENVKRPELAYTEYAFEHLDFGKSALLAVRRSDGISRIADRKNKAAPAETLVCLVRRRDRLCADRGIPAVLWKYTEERFCL